MIGLLLLLLITTAHAQTITVKPSDSLWTLRDKVNGDATLREVVFEAGVYPGSFAVQPLKDVDPGQHPLLIRAADGAKVVFDGSRRPEQVEPVADMPGVYAMRYSHPGGEYPKLWEPQMRMRYRLVADAQSVARFPATYTVVKGQLLFHTSDGKEPIPGSVLMSLLDNGMFINRSNVTVRGIHFRNYLAREKWSTGIDLRIDNITVEDCSTSNSSLGFIISKDGSTVRRCRVDDCGGGIYVGGQNATVQDCRLFKRRDGFTVPMYAQDDTGIQFYSPARGGTISGNLCVGFGMGIFLKAGSAPYIMEHNTIDGRGQRLGFGATNWKEGERFRFNIIANCRQAMEVPNDPATKDIDYNCYFAIENKDFKPVGGHDVVADPKFFAPGWEDYRLANDSPALALKDDRGPAGAFPAIGDATLTFGESREWHVSESGRDGRDGTADRPLRTIQHAVDRAHPGDTVLLHPGMYPDPVAITRGGVEGRPLIIRSMEKWGAILDSNRQAGTMISIRETSHVEIHDVEIRWYGSTAIGVYKSPHVTVSGCKIWNAHWYGSWPTGSAIRAEWSPHLTAHRNVLFRQEQPIWLYVSPNATVTHNTCASNVYTAVCLIYSAEGSVCMNNSFAFQGNDVILIEENVGQIGKLKSFQCDYNNYATEQRPQGKDVVYDTVKPREKEAYLSGGSKAIGNYMEFRGEMKRILTMAGWRELTGLDQHSIFADPLYVNTADRDFRLEATSPNIGAGKDGATIGALDVAK